MLHYLIVRQPRSYPATCGFDHFVTDATHKREPSKGNWAPFFCTSRASLRKQDVLWETSSVAKGEEKRLFYFSSFPFGCFMQAQRLESRLLSFMSKYKDLYGPRNTPWILVRVCTRTKQDMTQWSSKVRPCLSPVVVGCAMSPRSHRILLTCPFSKMADRQKTQNFDSGQKPAPLHGISLADFGGNLNFGPTLVPASQTPPVSSIIQPTATTSSSRGMNQLSTVFSP